MKSTKLLLIVLLLVSEPHGAATAQQQVIGEKYLVASGHLTATAVGLAVLREGGNVVDAAVATSLALGVAEPYGSGLGGKLVMLYRDAARGEVHCIEALCRSAAATDPEQFARLPVAERRYGYTAVCVPGLPAGLVAAHRHWGSRPWAELVEPAAQIAERGIQVSSTMRSMFAPKRETLRKDPEAASLYLVENDVPAVGAVLQNHDLGRSLRLFARGGVKAVYEGEIAERIVQASRLGGAPLTRDDFRSYRPRFTKPLAVAYRGHCVYSSPPPLTGGATVLATLKALEGERLGGKHLVVADAAGNMVSLTQSLSYHFGAGVVAPGTGILLNNSMSNFAVHVRESVNFVAPGKRPRSTLAPILVTRAGQPCLALGIPGGQRIPTTTIQLLADVIDRSESLGRAFELPRFHVRRPLSADEAPNIIDVEADAPAILDNQLIDLGWTPVRKQRDGRYFGGGNAVQYCGNCRLLGVADARRTNHAAGD